MLLVCPVVVFLCLKQLLFIEHEEIIFNVENDKLFPCKMILEDCDAIYVSGYSVGDEFVVQICF